MIRPVISLKVTLMLVLSHKSWKTFHYIVLTKNAFWIGWRHSFLAKYLAVTLRRSSKWAIVCVESTIKTLELGKILLSASNTTLEQHPWKLL